MSIQKKLKINRLKNNHLEIRKGANWFSITDDLASYLLTKREEIAKTYKFSNCADEIAVIKLNRIGSEGLSSQGYSGVSESYLDGYPAHIQKILDSKRLLKTL